MPVRPWKLPAYRMRNSSFLVCELDFRLAKENLA